MSAYLHPDLDSLVKLEFQARDVSLLPRQPIHSLLNGRHASRLRGRGLVFEELRRYRPGDDIRAIDWKATARLQAAFVRVYSEERDRPVLLVVDQRHTMFFGSARTTKATAAAEAAALAAWRTIGRGDRVGGILFGSGEIVCMKPQRSRGQVMRLCQALVRLNGYLAAGGAPQEDDSLNAALRRAVQVARHDHLVILITDYHGNNEETQRLVTQLAAHNDVLAALIYDPLGASLTGDGEMMATDGEEQVRLPKSSDFAARFSGAFQARCDQIRQRLVAVRIPILPICTHDPVPQQVAAALGRRK